MCAQRRNARKRRPRQPIPKTLPGDLFDYNGEPAPRLSTMGGKLARSRAILQWRVARRRRRADKE